MMTQNSGYGGGFKGDMDVNIGIMCYETGPRKSVSLKGRMCESVIVQLS